MEEYTMELIGGLVGDSQLDDTSLRGLLSLGTLSNAPFRLEHPVFPDVLKSFAKESKENRLNIRRSLESLSSVTALPTQEADFQTVKDSLIGEYLLSDIGTYFDELSPELFRIKRILDRSSIDGKTAEFTIPLFANVSLTESEWNYETISHSDARREQRVKITSKAPPITNAAKEKTKIFRAAYAEAIAKALREPIIGDIILRDIETGKADLNLQMYWIPRPQDLDMRVTIIDKDPFIGARVYDRHFLVENWDVEAEMPFKHYLREFKAKRLS